MRSTFTSKYKVAIFDKNNPNKTPTFVDLRSNDITIITSFDSMTQKATISIPYKKGKSMSYQALERKFYYDRNKYIEINQQLQIILYYDELFDPNENDTEKKDHSKRITYYGYLTKVNITETSFILELEDDMFLLKQTRLKISKSSTKLKDIIGEIDIAQQKVNPTNISLTKIFDVIEINDKYNFTFNNFNQLEPWSGAELLKMLIDMFDGTMFCFFRSGVLHFGIKYFAFISGYNDLNKSLRLGHRTHQIMIPNKSKQNDKQDISTKDFGLYCESIDFNFSTFDRTNTKINVISSIGGKSKYVSVFADQKDGKMNIDPDPAFLDKEDEKFLAKNIDKDDINLNYTLPNLDLYGMKTMAQNIWNKQVGGNLNKNIGSVVVFGNRYVKMGDVVEITFLLGDSITQTTEKYFVDAVEYTCNENGIRQKLTLGSNLISFGEDGVVDNLVKNNNIDQYE